MKRTAIVVLSIMLVISACLTTLRPVLAEGGRTIAPQQSAETMRRALFNVQAALMMGNGSDAQSHLAAAEAIYNDDLSAPIRGADKATDKRIRALFKQVEAGIAAGNAVQVAAARGQLWGEILGGSAAIIFQALEQGDAATAKSWLLLREFRTATKFSRPPADATLALSALERGEITAKVALETVRADLWDTYQAKMNEAFAEAALANTRHFLAKRAEAVGMAAGYFSALTVPFEAQKGAEGLLTAQAAFITLIDAAIAERPFEPALTDVENTLRGFRAVALSAAAAARRAGQFSRFIALVSVEYGRGVRDGQVINDIEIQEALTFRDAAQAAFDDLYFSLVEQETAAADEIRERLRQIDADIRATVNPAQVDNSVNQVAVLFSALIPTEWGALNTESDFDVIEAVLDQLSAALRAGQYDKAESARVEAYAILDSGIEQKLRGFQPELGNEIEMLFWHGTAEQQGLATLLGSHAPVTEVMRGLGVLRAKLNEAESYLSSKSAPAAVIGNSAVIVFREGLEAVLILASLLASLRSAETRKFRTPIIGGAILALGASALTWVIANSSLMALIRYGERLEAVVSLIAIGVLLLILNWFFHKVYWTGWIAGFHSRKGRIIAGGLAVGQIISLMVLGFSSIYREDFETVLFLQSLVLDAGIGVVLQGVLIGLIGVAIVGVITFALQVRLPYKKMLIVTGIMIAAVLFIMVGNTVHVLQAVGWLPITPIRGIYMPHWVGQWFGLYATWQGIGLQAAALVYVVGTYFWAERAIYHKKHTQAKAKKETKIAGQVG